MGQGQRHESAEIRVKRQLEAHLSDPFTSRDLFGVVRGRCTTRGCTACVGGYLKRTADYTVQPDDDDEFHDDDDTNDGATKHRDLENSSATAKPPRLHPHNDPSLMDCNRCGCPAGAHEVGCCNEADIG